MELLRPSLSEKEIQDINLSQSDASGAQRNESTPLVTPPVLDGEVIIQEHLIPHLGHSISELEGKVRRQTLEKLSLIEESIKESGLTVFDYLLLEHHKTKSLRQLSQELGVNFSTIIRIFDKLSLPKFSLSEASRRRWCKLTPEDRYEYTREARLSNPNNIGVREFDQMVEKLRIDGKTNIEIGTMQGASNHRVNKAVRRLIRAGKIEPRQGHYEIIEEFFDSWSPQLTYFLGLFAADGNMYKGKTKKYQVAIDLKANRPDLPRYRFLRFSRMQ